MVKSNTINSVKYSKEDLEILYKVADDFLRKEETDLKCPKCGNDFAFDGNGVSFQINCVTDDCLQLTCRGI